MLGPNCQGIWSVRRKTMLTFSPAALNTENLLHSPIAIISQSGALAGAIGNSLLKSGMGCSYIVSVGNETCLDAIDALESVIEQDDVKAVALYIEGFEDAARILPIAQRARERGVQIVVLKAGRSAIGQQATASHTGKIASSHAVYADVLGQAGVISVDSLQDAIAAVEVLAFLPPPRVSSESSRGVSVMSASGGAGALLADYSSEFDLPMAEFSPQTERRLQEVLPEFARKANPIDLTGQVNTDRDLFKNVCEAVTADPRTEAVVVQFSSSGRRYIQENGEVYKEMAKQQVPVVVSFIGETMENEVRKEFRDAGVLLSPDPYPTMKALSLLYRRQRALSLPALAHRAPLARREAPRDWEGHHGLPRGQRRDAGQVGGAQARGPCGAGLRRVDVSARGQGASLRFRPQDRARAGEVAGADPGGGGLLRTRLPRAHGQAGRRHPGAGDGWRWRGSRLSCIRQTDFGPILSIGTGGVAIELYRDITNLALPTTKEQVLEALKKLKLYTLLQGFRGKPAADIEALAEAAVRFGDMFMACPDALEFEINPVIVKAKGRGLSAVDALVTAAPAQVAAA